MNTRGGERILIGMTLAALVASCGDPFGPQSGLCSAACVPSFDVSPHHMLITIGDTIRYSAKARTSDGVSATVLWVARAGETGNIPVTIDERGLARGVSAGRGYVDAHAPNQATGGGGRAEVWVVSPDTSAQPFIAFYRDPLTGETIPDQLPFVGRDSIDIVISYVVGNFTNATATPTLVFQVRPLGATRVVYSTVLPAPVRGKGATTTVRLNLRMRNPDGSAVFEQRTYEFYVLLPLADGRALGDQTGYAVVF